MTPIALPDDPRAQAQQMIADARQDFAVDVDVLLTILHRFSDGLGLAGQGDRDDVVRVAQQFVLEKFAQRVRMPSLEAAVLRQLVREAYDALTNPETQINLQDWTTAAEPFVRS